MFDTFTMNFKTALYTTVALIVGCFTILMVTIILNFLVHFVKSIIDFMPHGLASYELGQLSMSLVGLLFLTFLTYGLFRYTKYCWKMRKV